MKKNIEIILNFRKCLLDKIGHLSTEQLNIVPERLNNNIIWNLGHLDAVLQVLCYQRSNLPITVESKYFSPFLPGTKPAAFVSDTDIRTIKSQLITSVEQLNIDLRNKRFETYQQVEKIKKVYHIDIESLDDSLEYLTHHEGIHYGVISNLVKLIP